MQTARFVVYSYRELQTEMFCNKIAGIKNILRYSWKPTRGEIPKKIQKSKQMCWLASMLQISFFYRSGRDWEAREVRGSDQRLKGKKRGWRLEWKIKELDERLKRGRKVREWDEMLEGGMRGWRERWEVGGRDERLKGGMKSWRVE